MFRTFLLATLIVAAGVSVAASADRISQWDLIAATPVATSSAGTTVPEPDTYPMYLAALGLMGFIARRRTL